MNKQDYLAGYLRKEAGITREHKAGNIASEVVSPLAQIGLGTVAGGTVGGIAGAAYGGIHGINEGTKNYEAGKPSLGGLGEGMIYGWGGGILGTIYGALAGAGLSTAAVVAGAGIAALRKRRTSAEQAGQDTENELATNILVPGAGAYNAVSRLKSGG